MPWGGSATKFAAVSRVVNWPEVTRVGKLGRLKITGPSGPSKRTCPATVGAGRFWKVGCTVNVFIAWLRNAVNDPVAELLAPLNTGAWRVVRMSMKGLS